jgi:hypothetical protein
MISMSMMVKIGGTCTYILCWIVIEMTHALKLNIV